MNEWNPKSIDNYSNVCNNILSPVIKKGEMKGDLKNSMDFIIYTVTYLSENVFTYNNNDDDY